MQKLAHKKSNNIINNDIPLTTEDPSKNSNKEEVKSLIESHYRVLSRIKDHKFTINFEDDFVELSESFITQFLDKLSRTEEINISEILKDDSTLDVEVKRFINKYRKEIAELEEGKEIGIAYPCFLEENKKRYIAMAIFSLELKYGSSLIFKVKKLEKNESLQRDLKKLIEKAQDHTSAPMPEVKVEILKDILDILATFITPYLVVPKLALTLYGSLSQHKALYERLKSPKDVKQEQLTQTKEQEKVAILFTFENTQYIENLERDFRDILENFDTAYPKLSMLFKEDGTPQTEAIEREYFKNTYVSLNKGFNLQESQGKNYGRMLKQKITAIQGPPGTGKTQLIAQYCLDRIFESLCRSFDGKEDHHTVLITSTNNKAVENVLNKLEEFDRNYTPNELLTGKYLKGYIRLGSKEKNREAYEKELKKICIDINDVEVETSLKRLREDIEPLLRCVDEYKDKQNELFSVEDKCKDLQKRYTEIKMQINEIQKAHDDIVQMIFVNPILANSFNRENLITLNQIMAKLRSWIYLFFPRYVKGRLYRFCLDKSIRLSGMDDLKYLSRKEIYERNKDLIKNLEEYLRIRESLEELKGELEKVIDEERKFQEVKEKLLLQIENEKGNFEENVLKLFIRLREYHFWKILSDSKIIEKIKSFQSDNNWWSIYRYIQRITPVVICTALSVRNIFPCISNNKNTHHNNKPIFDTVIVDEASQTLLTYSLPLFLRGERFVAIGDTKQLGPVQKVSDDGELEEIFSDLPGHLWYKKSIMEAIEAIDKTDEKERRLIEHFRCRPKIIGFCNELMGYGLKIKTTDEAYQPKKSFPPELKEIFEDAITFINIDGKSERISGSKCNEKEIEFIKKLLEVLIQYIDPNDVAVITPYRAQANRLSKNLPTEIVVGTVHKLQGDEREILLVSAVDSNPDDFEKSPLWTKKELVNVTVSRAKKHFILIGNENAIKDIKNKENSLFRLYEYISRNGRLIDGTQFCQ